MLSTVALFLVGLSGKPAALWLFQNPDAQARCEALAAALNENESHLPPPHQWAYCAEIKGK